MATLSRVLELYILLALPKKHTRTISPALELKKLYNKKEPFKVVNIGKKHSQEEILSVFASSSSFLNSSIKRIKPAIPKHGNKKNVAISDTSLHLLSKNRITSPTLNTLPSSSSKTRREDFSEAPPLSRSASERQICN